MRRPGGFALVLGALAVFHLVALFAGFFAPYRFDTQDREHPYAPPSRIHFVDSAGNFHWRPFVYGLKSREDAPLEYEEDRAIISPLRFFTQGEPYTLLWVIHSRLHVVGVEEPARVYLLGSDGLGRDQMSRLLYGAEVSLLAGLLAAAFSVGLGTAIGGVAGLYGGRVDQAVMRIAEVFMAVPWFYLLLAIRAFLPLQMNETGAFFLVIAVLGAVWWARPARLVRGVVLSARERNFVLAARGFGGSHAYIWRKHILPVTMGVSLTQFTLLVPQSIMVEGILSFLGLGIGEPAPSWGNMLAVAQQYHIIVSYWWMLLPVLVPIPLFFTYQLFADRLQTRLQLDQ
ncbi:MAG: ABC transporter permease [Acidobacteriia bacterium]|nr:ABC transporter permease [Terriglobia bacterium]